MDQKANAINIVKEILDKIEPVKFKIIEVTLYKMGRLNKISLGKSIKMESFI